MDLTREDALALFCMMWTDMQDELGDNPEYDQRVDYKEKWINAKFPYRHVENDCFLCECVKFKDIRSCKHCPIDWGRDGIYENACEKLINPGVDWRKSPISKILALPEREDVQMYKCETEFGTYNVSIETSTYYYGGNLAINLITEDGEPFATLTTNLAEWTLPKDKSFVDTNNCPWAEKFIADNKLGRPTGIKAASGYCVYPQYRFDMEKLK